MHYKSEDLESVKQQSKLFGNVSVYIKTCDGNYQTGGVCFADLLSINELANEVINDALNKEQTATISIGTLSGGESCREIVKWKISRNELEMGRSAGVDVIGIIIRAALNELLGTLLESYARHNA